MAAPPPELPETLTAPELSDRFAMVVDLIKHEDNLVNLRTNWALGAQAFLLTAFTFAVGLFEKFTFEVPHRTPIHVGLFIICGLGILSCLGAFLGVHFAERQQTKLSEWWVAQLPTKKDKAYPPLYPFHEIQGNLRASRYFLVIAAVWVAVVFVIVCSTTLGKATSTAIAPSAKSPPLRACYTEIENGARSPGSLNHVCLLRIRGEARPRRICSSSVRVASSVGGDCKSLIYMIARAPYKA